MDPDRWREIRALFDELVELPAERRARRLEEVGATAPDLRRAVSELLDADSAASARLASVDGALLLPEAGDRIPSPDPLGLLGQTLSHFRILDLIGAGGMGAVYRAEDLRLGRIVALKLPLPSQLTDASGRSRFLREARAVAALDHPNVCDVHEAGEAEHGHLFLAMPHYPGETLKERLRREGAIAEALAIDIARQVARGLGAAHRAGIVHRDLKPGNVMLLPDGTVKLLDFGVAKSQDASVTATGGRLGTVAYMAPEQVRGLPLDARTDLWALGVILYEMLTGASPFARDSDISTAHAILHDSPRPLSGLLPISPALSDLIARLLERDPAHRIASAAIVESELAPEMLARHAGVRHALARRIAGAARVGRRHRLALLAVLGIGALAVPVARYLSPPEQPRPPTSDAVALDLYLRGRDYESRDLSPEDRDNAGALYRRAMARDPAFSLARARYAITELRAYRSEEALEQAANEARTALAQQPDLGDAHLAMGLYWDRRSDATRAFAAYEAARARLPESGEVPLAIAEIHLREGRWDAAVAELERARELAPRDLATARLLALTYARLRRYEDATAAWELVTTRIPDDYQALLIKGYVYIRWLGTADTLAAVLTRIPAEWTGGGMKTYAGVTAARIARRPAEALPLLDSARWLVSADGYIYRPIHLLRAQLYDDLGDSASARISYERLMRLVRDTLEARPRDPRLHIALGLAYAGLGRTGEAVASARHAMSLVPAESNAFDGIPFIGAAAEVLARAGEAGPAVELLDSLLRIPAGREASVPLLRADPTWDPIRSDPRFDALLDRYD